MIIKLEFSLRHLWFGVYWESWPEPYRLDIWIAVPLIALHVIKEKKMNATQVMVLAMKVLTVEYFILALGFAVAKDWARSLYFFAAILINISITLIK